MATLLKTVGKTPTEREWAGLSLRFNRGDVQGALGAAAKRSRMSGAAWYVYAVRGGYVVDPNEPSLPKGGRFWRIVVVESSIRGELYEC